MKSIFKKGISIILIVLLCLSNFIAASFTSFGEVEDEVAEVWDGTVPAQKPEFSGAGSKDDPYLIENGAQLRWVVVNENAGVYFKLANDIILNDFKVEMNGDIPVVKDSNGNVITDEAGNIPGVMDPSGNIIPNQDGSIPEINHNFHQWVTAKFGTPAFQGVIDGDNHIIRGLYYNFWIDDTKDGTCGNYLAALIPNASNAEIRNIGFEDCYIKADHNGITTNGYAAAVLIGRVSANRGLTVKNSYIGKSVFVNAQLAGGFVGLCDGTYGDANSKETVFENLVSLPTLVNIQGQKNNYQGGIVAFGINLNRFNTETKTNATSVSAGDVITWKNSAKNVITTDSLFGGKSCFCENAYQFKDVNSTGPQNAQGPIKVTAAQMRGYAALNRNLGDAFICMPSEEYPVLKSFYSRIYGRQENEWDGSPDTELAGEGTKAAPYLITNAGELAYVVYTGGVENAYYKMTKDLVLNDGSKIDKTTGKPIDGYIPISWFDSSDVKEFKGAEFDGGGHVVSGIYCNFGGDFADGGNKGASALFPLTRQNTVGTVTIKNVGVADSYLRNYSSVAAIVGYAGNSVNPILVIDGCFAEEDVVLIGNFAGGIYCSGSINVTVTNCYSLAQLTSNAGRTGLVANWWSGTGKECHISDSYSTNKIAGNRSTTTENCYENFTKKGETALDQTDLDRNVWYAVKDSSKYPMLRSRGRAIHDIDENGIFEPGKDLAAIGNMLVNSQPEYHNADFNGDGNLDIIDLLFLKQYTLQIS